MQHDSSLKTISEAHEQILSKLRNAISAALESTAQATKDAVKADSSFKDVSGKLRKSIRHTKNKSGIRVFSVVTYAGYVENGTTGPYQITARRRKFLKFKVNGEWTFRKSVTHPGIKPRKYLFRASQSAFPKFGDALVEMLK